MDRKKKPAKKAPAKPKQPMKPPPEPKPKAPKMSMSQLWHDQMMAWDLEEQREEQERLARQYKSDARTAYLWHGGHGRYVSDAERRARIAAIEDVWMLIPKSGFIPEYIRHWLPTTDAPALFHVAGALTSVASILHRRIWMKQGGDRVVPMLWTVLLGQSTTPRKSTCVKAVASALPDNSIILPQSFTCAQILAKLGVTETTEDKMKLAMAARQSMLQAAPSSREGVGLLLLDEFTGLLVTLDQEYNHNTEELFHSIYEGKGWTHCTKTQGCTGIADGTAHLNIFGATTPEWLGRVAQARHIHEGFFPRYMFFYASESDYLLPVRDEPAHTDLGPETRKLVALQGGEKKLSLAAADHYAHWYRGFVANRDPEMSVWSQRLAVNCLKVALLYEACTSNGQEVSLENLQLACRLLDRVATDTTRLLEGDLAFGVKDSLVKTVRRIVCKERHISWRDLSRKLHRHSRSVLKSAIDTLLQQGVVEEAQGPLGGEGYKWIGD
jgi:hypothetical protein